MLEKYPNYYISIDLQATTANGCHSPAVLVENRICACPEDTYFDGYGASDEIRCAPLPDEFSRARLKLDIAYAYEGREHVQHHGLVTYEQCTRGHVDSPNFYLRRYMSQDEQYCVPECPPYQEAT